MDYLRSLFSRPRAPAPDPEKVREVTARWRACDTADDYDAVVEDILATQVFPDLVFCGVRKTARFMSPWHHLAWRGRADDLRRFIELGFPHPPADSPVWAGRASPLYLACGWVHPECIGILARFRPGYVSRVLPPAGRTPLSAFLRSCAHHHVHDPSLPLEVYLDTARRPVPEDVFLHCVRLLAGGDVLRRDAAAQEALFCTIHGEDASYLLRTAFTLPLLEELVGLGYDADFMRTADPTLACLAYRYNKAPVFEFLLDRGADPKALIGEAIDRDDVDTLRRLYARLECRYSGHGRFSMAGPPPRWHADLTAAFEQGAARCFQYLHQERGVPVNDDIVSYSVNSDSRSDLHRLCQWASGGWSTWTNPMAVVTAFHGALDSGMGAHGLDMLSRFFGFAKDASLRERVSPDLYKVLILREDDAPVEWALSRGFPPLNVARWQESPALVAWVERAWRQPSDVIAEVGLLHRAAARVVPLPGGGAKRPKTNGLGV